MKNMDSKIDKDLTALVQDKWERFVKESDIDNLRLPIEAFKVMRVVFQLAYQEGQADTFTQLKQVFEEDIDLFEEIFEDDIDRKLLS